MGRRQRKPCARFEEWKEFEKSPLTWQQSAGFVIPFPGHFESMTLRDVAEEDAGLLWLDKKAAELPPWMPLRKAIDRFLARGVIQDEIQKLLDRHKTMSRSAEDFEDWFHMEHFHWES